VGNIQQSVTSVHPNPLVGFPVSPRTGRRTDGGVSAHRDRIAPIEFLAARFPVIRRMVGTLSFRVVARRFVVNEPLSVPVPCQNDICEFESSQPSQAVRSLKGAGTSERDRKSVEKNRLILRLDMATRSDELKAKLQAAPDWDLVICDEAYRMAASYFGRRSEGDPPYYSDMAGLQELRLIQGLLASAPSLVIPSDSPFRWSSCLRRSTSRAGMGCARSYSARRYRPMVA
jgi:hypothetical protein